MSTRRADLYFRPEIYDILYAPAAGPTIRLLEKLADRLAPRRSRLTWLEPACGSGRHLRALSRRGHRVLGFDRSPPMVEYARRSLGSGGQGIIQADMSTFGSHYKAASIDVALNVDNTLRHLPTDTALVAHLTAMAGVLRPGGLYFTGLSFHRPPIEAPTEDVWTARRGGTRVTKVVQYLPPEGAGRTERVLAHLTVETPGGRETFEWSYNLRSWTLEQWTRALRRTPFEWVTTVDADGDPVVPGVFDYDLLVLRRPRAGA